MERNHRHYDQLVETRDATCELHLDADRITLRLEKVYSKAILRIGEELERMRICAYSLSEPGKLYLMQPDYGMFGSEEELRIIISELFNEENYEIIYK